MSSERAAHAPSAGMLARLRGSPLLLMLDVDGTLAPIAARPADAAVPPETRRLISDFAARADTRVVLVSGRAAADALRLVGVIGLWAAGNHGFELIWPDGTSRAHPGAEPFRNAISDAVAALRAELFGIDGVLVEDKTLTISVHYRQVDPASVDRVRQTARRVADEHGLGAGDGKMIVEIRPPVAVNKGTAVLALIDELDGSSAGASIFFAGDDVTDEDAFIQLRAVHPRAVTVHVGAHAETAAEFRVRDIDAFRSLLAALLGDRSALSAADPTFRL